MRCPPKRRLGVPPYAQIDKPRDLQIGAQGLRLAVGDTTQDAGLFNNATDGSYLVVWDCSISVAPEPGSTPGNMQVTWGVSQQGPFSTPTPGFPLIPNAPQGYGIVWAHLNTPGIFPVPYTALLLTSQGAWHWPHDWPMCYIPQGFSLVVEFSAGVTAGAIDVNATWMWQSGARIP